MPALLASLRSAAVILGLLLAGPAAADEAAPATAAAPAPGSEAAREQELQAAWIAAHDAAIHGPSDVALLDQAKLHLPPETVFVPPAAAARLLRAWGNRVAVDPLGLVFGTRDDDRWAVTVRFNKEGYVKDDDAKTWNADEMLSSIRDGNEEANAERRTRGFPETEIIGWIAPPAYDPTTHRLVSALAQRNKDAPATAVQGVNYLTYALGRDGYFAFELLTNQEFVAHDRVSSAKLIDGLDYTEGHRYADFNASTDHIAAYGLAALVGVVAVKKLGLLALAGAFALKFAKLGAVAVALVGGAAARLLRRRRSGGGAA